jgi:hypothetical protein
MMHMLHSMPPLPIFVVCLPSASLSKRNVRRADDEYRELAALPDAVAGAALSGASTVQVPVPGCS